MKDAAATTAQRIVQKTATKAQKIGMPADQSTALDRCYGQIGISAVAAAVRYQGGAKNPAYAPVPTKLFEAAGEAA